MSTLYMLVGIPGSGKTTFALKKEKEDNIKVVSSDRVRILHPEWNEELIFPEVYRLTSEYLKNGFDVILDATNITPKVRKRVFDAIDSYNVSYNKIAYFFDAKVDECVERVKVRNTLKGELFLPLDVIASYSEKIIKPSKEEGFDEIYVL